tara:strand:+ start:44 stop:562 length:519 start_codon:yes stop_codon:yes gene_type:complete
MNKISYSDNVVPTSLRHQINEFCLRSIYTLGWQDSQDPSKYIPNLHSNWSIDDLDKIQILPHIQKCIDKTPWFTGKKLNKTVVNLVRPMDVHYIHHHRTRHVALYYANLDWEDGWYGETIFYDEFDENNIIFTSPYVPGRIILFDGNIPHTIRPQSIDGPKFRISITLFFDE